MPSVACAVDRGFPADPYIDARRLTI